MRNRYARVQSLRSFLLTLLVGLGVFQGVNSQGIPNYVFSTNAGVYTPLSGGISPALSGGSLDDGWYNNIPIGFPFLYNGFYYSQMAVSTNGWVALGNNLTTSVTTNNLATGSTSRPVLAPLWDDLALLKNPTYQTTGLPGARVFTLQYDSIYFNYNAIFPVLSAQLKIYEATSAIEFVYTPEGGAVNLGSASIGINAIGTGAGNYASVTTTATWSGATVSNTLETTTNNTLPDPGRTFAFTPPSVLPAAPTTLTFAPVGLTSMTLNWVDNSTNELNFYVEISTDGVTFNQLSYVTSTTTAGTGTPYTLPVIGLSPNTLYYFRITALSEGFASAPLTGQQATPAGVLCGIYTVGSGGNYADITAAFTDINNQGLSCSVVLELLPTYSSATEVFPLNVPFFGGSPTLTLTVRPHATVNTPLLVSNGLANTFNFSGSTFTTFDGRPGGSGSGGFLFLDNTSLTSNTIFITNNSSDLTFRDLRLGGANNTTTGGVIAFGVAASSAGANQNISITGNDFGLASNGFAPRIMIYALSATGLNRFVTISNNLFHDYYFNGENHGINASTGTTDWTVTGNSFYQTNPQAPTSSATQSAAIRISNSSTGNNFNISGNFIGGNQPNAGGAPMVYNSNAAYRFTAITLAASTNSTSTVSNNIIRNITLSSTSGPTTPHGLFAGIHITGGTFQVTNNTIGSTTANNSIVVTSTTSGAISYGIAVTSGANHTISGNQIGGFTLNGSTATISSSFVGINISGGTFYTVTNNLIGSNSVSSNIVTANSSGTTAGILHGINSSSSSTNTFSNNRIVNLTNAYTGTSASSLTRGIIVTSGVNTVTDNFIGSLSTATGNTSTTATSAALAGIQMSSTSAGNAVVSRNTIVNLAHLNPTAAYRAAGIIYNGAGLPSLGEVSRNQISYIGTLSSSVTGEMYGILHSAGGLRAFNNTINLGIDSTGASVAAPVTYSGIHKTTSVQGRFYNNTIKIDGTSTGSAGVTSAFRRTIAATAPDTLINNILVNYRQNTTPGPNHYSIYLEGLTNYVGRKNNLQGTGPNYFTAGSGVITTPTTYLSLATWRAAINQDLGSFAVAPAFVSSTNVRLTPTTPTPLESFGETIPFFNNDVDGQTRPGPAGSVNGGGFGYDIGADEFDGFPLPLDMGVAALISPTQTCLPNLVNIRVRLRNYSTTAIDFSVDPVSVDISVAGPNPVTFPTLTISTGTLAGQTNLDTLIALNYDISAVGTYVFTGTTILSGDANTINDALPTTNIIVSGGTASTNNTSICGGSSAVLTLAGSGGAIQWQSFDPLSSTWQNVPGAITASETVTPTDTTQYRALVCGALTSNTVTVNVNAPVTPVVNPITVCGATNVTLNATNTQGTTQWFTAPTGGAPIATGTSYSVLAAQTQTFYAANFVTGGGSSFVGPANNAIGTGSGTLATFTTSFNVLQSLTLRSVTMYPVTAGSVTILITNSGGVQVASVPVTFNSSQLGTAVVVPIMANLPPGNGYTMAFATGGTGTYWRNTAGATFPYTIPGFISITGNSFDPLYYYYFYNWEIETGCSSPRVAGNITVNPAPAINLAASSNPVCNNAPSTLTASSSNAGYSYDWVTAAGSLANDTNQVVVTPTTATSYFVFATDTLSGCSNVDTLVLGVLRAPVATVTPSADTLCAGTSLPLTAALAADTIQVGTGVITNSATSYPTPYGNFYWGARHQFLVLASELQALGYSAGQLTSLSFDVANVNLIQAHDNVEIKLGHTSVGNLTAWQAGLQTVHTNASYLPVNGWNLHNFQTPFAWDGVSNIVVEFCFNNTSFDDNASVRQTTMPFTASYWFRDDVSGVCSDPSNSGSSLDRPNMRFGYALSTVNAWTPSAGLSSTTLLNTVATPTQSTTYQFTANAANGCIGADSSVLFVPAPIQVSLGNDTAFCAGQTFGITLDAQNPGATYLWQDNSTNQQLSANAGGIYNVTVTDAFGCQGGDTLVVVENVNPVVSLGNDLDYCANVSFTQTLDAGNASASFAWSTGASTQTIAVTQQGVYSVVVTDVNGCTGTDTVVVTENPAPVAAITVANLQASGADLAANAGFNSYAWSTGQTTQNISVTASGSYWVLVTDANGCTDYDTVQVTLPLGIGESGDDVFKVRLWPNPAAAVAQLHLEHYPGMEAECTIYDISGKLMMQQNLEVLGGAATMQVNMHDWAPGTYMVVVRGAAAPRIFRLIRQ